ncbi:MAG: hypothetical protein JO307_08395 [Bryobacterales bacterium]|nr:hypothetical protein [Bryobacterales bacterium]MBV9399170.1 hypothetical protein [Bryobacterales bacterium]
MSGEEADFERLSQRLLEALDAERERIARVLHDDLGQQVASLSILTSTLKRRLPPEDTESYEQAHRIREKLIALAGSMRRLSHELYPTLLEHAGLEIALRQLCEELAADTRIRISYQSSGDFQDVPLPLGLSLYRIAEEILRNCGSERPEAETVVRLARSAGNVELTLEGENAADFVRHEAGLAIECCRKRLKNVSVRHSLENPSGRGWSLTVSIPWKPGITANTGLAQ